MSNINWYALYTMPRAEKKVHSRLEEAGYTVYLPLTTSFRVWSDRKKKITAPLISSYVFICLEEEQLKNIFSIQGVCGILKYLNKPAIIKPSEIELLKVLMNDSENVNVMEDFQFNRGESVSIIRGPFKGLEAKYCEIQGKFRTIVHVEGLGLGFEINLPKSFIEKK